MADTAQASEQQPQDEELKEVAVLVMSLLTHDRAQRPMDADEAPEDYLKALRDNLTELTTKVVDLVNTSVKSGDFGKALKKLDIATRAFNNNWEWDYDNADPTGTIVYPKLLELWISTIDQADLGFEECVDWVRMTESLSEWPEFSYFDADNLSGSDTEDDSRHKDLPKKLRDNFLSRHKSNKSTYDQSKLKERLEKMTDISQATSLMRGLVNIDHGSAVQVALRGIQLDNEDTVLWAPKGPDGRPLGNKQPANPLKWDCMKVFKAHGQPSPDTLGWILGLKFPYECRWALDLFTDILNQEQFEHCKKIVKLAQESTSAGTVSSRDANHV